MIALLRLASSKKAKQRAADLRAVTDALGFNYAGSDSPLAFQANRNSQSAMPCAAKTEPLFG
jgi:hypothetical protein